MPTLAEHHRVMLEQSALGAEIMLLRHYTTFTEPHELRACGFSETQSYKVPALGIPLYDVYGQQCGWQIRPDNPDLDLRNGRPKKYLTPARSRLPLDIHPTVQPLIDDPGIRLWITEGVKKGDALASLGECAIALVGGVWGWRGGNSKGGKTALSDWNGVALNGRDVFVVYDNDVMRKGEVRHALEALFAFLQSKGAQPHLVLLPESEEKIGIDDYFFQGHTMDDLLRCEASRLPAPEHAPNLKPGVPLITQHPHQLAEVATQALAALRTMPGSPHVFQRAQMLVSIMPGDPSIPGIDFPLGGCSIQPLTGARLRLFLARAANWQTPNKHGTKVYPDKPADWLTQSLLDHDAWEGVPPLLGMVNTPTLRRDGSFVTESGYDAHTGLFVKLNEPFPATPSQPTQEEACRALHYLAAPFKDYRWRAPCHYSAYLASILSLLARYAIDNVPLFAIRSPIRGTGKSKLAHCAAILATGRRAALFPPVKEEEEERKRLLSVAISGIPLMVIDNVKGSIGSAALDLAITSRTIQDRVLGKNSLKESPLYTVFFATGNNMAFEGDLARRTLPIEIESDDEHPELREDFAYPNLEQHILTDRANLVCAGLTALRAYIQAGMPTGDLPAYGSFESWSKLIRGCLVWCGWEDPCQAREQLEETSDPAYDMHRELLQAWHACYDSPKPRTLRSVVGEINSYPVDEPRWGRLRDALGAYDHSYDGKHINLRRIGKGLRQLEGRWNGTFVLRLGTSKERGDGLTYYVQGGQAKKYDTPF